MEFFKPIILISVVCLLMLFGLRHLRPNGMESSPRTASTQTQSVGLDETDHGHVPSGAVEKNQPRLNDILNGSVLPVAESGQVNVDQLPPKIVLERRVTDIGNGEVRRLFLVNGGGSYPYHRIEELLRYDASKDAYVVVRQTLIVADHFMVKLRPGCTQADLEVLNASLGTRIISNTGFPDIFLIQLATPSLDGVPEMMSAYGKETNLVLRTYVDSIDAPSAVPNDTIWSSMWDKQRISCPAAWDWETGSTNIIIAIIDMGIDLDHPDLAAHLWHNPGEAGALATNGIDDDGNGYVDDSIGWDWGAGDNDPDDNGDADKGGDFAKGGHGTHCAGIAGAIGNNSNQVVGVCWNVTIMALKPFEYMSDTKDMRVYSYKAVLAMKYAADKGAKVTSNSYGGPGSGDSYYYEGINYQNSHGVLFVAAAGNNRTNNDVVAYEPAGVDLPNVIAVASSSYLTNETLYSSSNYGETTVDIVAPGSSILSTVSGGGTTNKSGTSMATPQVAGAIALLYSYDPDLPYLTCKQLILDGVDVSAAYSNKCVSHGRLNVAKSLDLLDAAVPDMDTDGLPNKWEIQYFGGKTNANPTATASNGVNTVLQCYIAGLNPTSAASFFKVTGLEKNGVGNGFVVRWSAVSGRVYSVYSSSNLLLNNFQNLATNLAFPQSSYTDSVYQAGQFYKIDVRLAP